MTIDWKATKQALSDYVSSLEGPTKGKVWLKESKNKDNKTVLKKVEMTWGRQIQAFFNPSPPHKLANVAKTIAKMIAKMPLDQLDVPTRRTIELLADKLAAQATILNDQKAYIKSQEMMKLREEMLRTLTLKSAALKTIREPSLPPEPKIEEKAAEKPAGPQEPEHMSAKDVQRKIDEEVEALRKKNLEVKLTENPAFQNKPQKGGPKPLEEPFLTLSIGNCSIALNRDILNFKADFLVNAANSSMLGGGGIDGVIHESAGTTLKDTCKLFKEEKGDRAKTGDAKMTPGAGKLLAPVVMHAVGPSLPTKPPKDRVDKETPILKKTYDTVLQNADAYVAARKNRKYPDSDLWPHEEGIPLRNLTYTKDNWNKRIAGTHSEEDSARSDALDGKIEADQPLSIALPAISMGIFNFPPEQGMPIAMLSVLEYINRHNGNPPIKHFHFALLKRDIHKIGHEEITKIATALGAPTAKQE